MKTHALLLLLPISLLLTCCKDHVYMQNRDIAPEGWHMDSLLTYEFEIADTAQAYDLLLYVRHLETYPYQNLWLFMQQDSLHRDTIEFYLADDRGVWLGNAGNGHITMPVIYYQNYHFAQPGHQTLRIGHGMRTDLLRGVTDVELEINRVDK